MTLFSRPDVRLEDTVHRPACTYLVTIPLLAVLFFGVAFSSRALALDSDNPAPTMAVTFGRVTYHLPKIYLPGVTPFQANSPKAQVGSGYASFTLGLLLPNFQPAGLNVDEFNRVGWHNQLRALFEYGRQFLHPAEIIERYLSWGKAEKNDYIALKNGCVLYKLKIMFREEFYVCGPADRILLVQCTAEKIVPSPYCTITENISEETTVIYSYSRSYIDDAISIDNHIRELLSSFDISRENIVR